jgi:acetyl esterase/lipase
MMFRRAAALLFCIAASFAARSATAAPYPTVSFGESAVFVNEDAGTVTLHLIRTGDLSLESKVAMQMDFGSRATSGTDFTGFESIVTFAPFEATHDMVITIIDDTLYEGTETFTPYMYSTYQAEIGEPSRVTVTIADTDPLTLVGFAEQTYSVSEAAGVVTISLIRSGVTTVASTVAFKTHEWTAHEGTDYSGSGTVTFAPGETLKSFTIPIVNDTTHEPLETFTVTLSIVAGGAAIDSTATVAIVDDDIAAQLAFSPSSYNVDEDGLSVTVTIVRSANVSLPTTVNYSTSNGTATGADYLSTFGTVTFAPGETVKTFVVPIFDDVAVEGTESFFVYLVATDASEVSGPATITIIDNDTPPTLAFTPVFYDLAENAGPVTVTVTRSGAIGGSTVATYTTVNGSALSGDDFTATAGTLTFAPGETQKTISVPLVNDSVSEPSETFTVTLSASGAVITSGTANIRIEDDDVQAVFSLDTTPADLVESSGSVLVTFRRTGDTTHQGTVGYTTVNGTATGGSDYVAQSGTMVFGVGETVKTTTVGLLNDSLTEGTETFSVQLMNPVGGTLGRATHTISILDDDQVATPPTYRFSPTFYEVSEGAGSVTVTMLREGNLSAPSVVNYSTAPSCCGGVGAATTGVDYLEVSGTLSFAAGQASKTISIPILQDNLVETAESFRVGVAGAFYPEVTVSIKDDEAPPRLIIDDVVVDEGNAGTKQATMTLRLSVPAQYPVSLYYSSTSGSAKAPGDYAALSGYVSFLTGETVKTIPFTINGDTVDEGDEYFTISFDSYTCCDQPTRGTAMVTIRNDDATFSVGDVAVNEGDGGTAHATFTVRLSVPLPSPASVHYATTPGTAQFESDFTGVSGTLTFAPGETSKEVAVPVIGDRVAEPNETFFLRLSDAVGAPISRTLGKATIVNDDEFFIEYDGIEYAGAGKHALALDLFVPTTESAAPRPLVLWIHGDHWSDGSRAASPAIREANRGYVVASIDYRSSDAAVFPAQIDDVKAAVRWLRANAARYNIDPERVAVWGFGSGGHLAALLGTSGGVASLEDPSEGNPAFSSRVQLVVDWAGATDLQQLQNDSLACSTTNHDSAGSFASLLIGCGVQRCPDRAAQASPISYVTPDDPPFLLMHGGADCEVGPAQSESFARVLRAAQVEAALRVYDGVGHTGQFWDTQEALNAVDAFLDAHLKAPPRSRAAAH